ncbi:MAG: hypothetical protein Q8942_00485 [Bacillota bacterium]|nr:hypothetical protein [Bacillota bacterium]
MKLYIFLSIFVIIVLTVVLTGCYSNLNTKLELKSGDIIPSSIKIFNTSGKANSIDDVRSKYKVVFYLDSANEDCMNRLDCVSKMTSLISFEAISYVIVWEDSIPLEKIKKAGIVSSYNYSLKNKASLSESKPTAFLVDENNKVIMVTGYSYISLINKIIELGDKKDLYNKAEKMIFNNVSKSGSLPRKDNGKTLLMFMSSGCRRCKEDEDIVKKNIDAMQEKINIITVRPDFDIKQNYDKYFELDPQMIYFNIFAYALGIDANNRKYPMFVIVNSKNSIEKFFTNVDEAVNYTLGL